MRKYFFVIISLCLILNACSSKTNNNTEDSNIIHITEKDLPTLQHLDLEKIELDEDLNVYASDYFVYHDTVLLVLHVISPDPYFLTLMDLRTKEVICEYFPRGEGPNELLSIIGYLNMNIINLEDRPQQKNIFFNIDSALILKDKYIPKIFNKEIFFAGYGNQLTDSTYIYYNQSYFNEPTTEIKSPEGVKEYVFINNNNETSEPYIQNDDFFAGNYASAHTIVNRNKQRIVFAYNHVPRYKLYDYNMNLLKHIEGPEENDGKYKREEFDPYMVVFDKYANFYTMNYTSTDNTVVIQNGKSHNIVDNVVEMEIMASSTAEIDIYDWELNMLKRYEAHGHPIWTISYSDSTKTLYVTSFDEEGEKSLYKAVLK